MSRRAPTDAARREAASQAVRDRMQARRITIPDLIERTGLTENTVRDMAYGNQRHNKSSWIAMSWALEYMPDHLFNVLNGKADSSSGAESPMERRLAEMVNELAQIGALRGDVATLKDVIHQIDQKIDVVIEHRHPSSD